MLKDGEKKTKDFAHGKKQKEVCEKVWNILIHIHMYIFPIGIQTRVKGDDGGNTHLCTFYSTSTPIIM